MLFAFAAILFAFVVTVVGHRNKALSFTFLSAPNSSVLRSGSLVLVSGLYFVFLQNTHVSGSTAGLADDPCVSRAILRNWG